MNLPGPPGFVDGEAIPTGQNFNKTPGGFVR